MKLVDDIIQSVTEAEEPIARTLRRCLVLAYELNNETFKTWLQKELDGYSGDDELPDYREATGTAKGFFIGPLGAEIRNQPLPSSVLREEHRHFAREIKLRQPIAAYDQQDTGKTAMLLWPADLVVLYQDKFFDGYSLNRAWMEIPTSLIAGLVDTVRTRVLTFALQMREELQAEENNSPQTLTPAVVERIVNVTILGGNNVLGNVQEFAPQTVVAGDLSSLKHALSHVGVREAEIAELETAIGKDGGTDKKSLGQRTQKWIAETAKKLGGAGVKIGGAVAEEALKRAVMGYLGLS